MRVKYNPKNLTLNDIIRMFDPLTYVVIWTQDNDETSGPDWIGHLLDLPWFYLDGVIGSKNPKDDEPISFRENLGEECGNRSGVVISLILP